MSRLPVQLKHMPAKLAINLAICALHIPSLMQTEFQMPLIRKFKDCDTGED
jgi:hypothetical protein